MGSVLLIFLVFFVYYVSVCFLIPCCNVLCDFRMQTVFGSSLFPVVCRRAHVLFTLFVFACVQWYGFALLVFVLCPMFPMLPVSLDCSFFIAPSRFFETISYENHQNPPQMFRIYSGREQVQQYMYYTVIIEGWTKGCNDF